MIGVDVGLDLASAWKHFASGDVWWGSLTLALAFAPALAVLASIAARRAVKVQVDEDEHYWHHLPGIQVLVNLVRAGLFNCHCLLLLCHRPFHPCRCPSLS